MEEKKVLYELKELDSMIIRNTFKKFKGANIHLGPRHGLIMSYLFEHKNDIIYQRDLEKLLNVRRSTLSGIIKTIEKHGFIIRKDSLKDQRLKEIVLTDMFYAMFNDAEKSFNELEKKIVKGISNEELHTFFRVVDKIKNNLREEGKND